MDTHERQEMIFNYSPDRYSSDRGFVDLAVLLLRKKRLIFCLFCLPLLIAIGVYFARPPLYEAQVTLEVKEVLPSLKALVPTPTALARRISEEYNIGNRDGKSVKTPYILSVREFGNIVKITSLGETPEESEKFLEFVTNKLVAETNKLLTESKSIYQGHISGEVSKADMVAKQLAEMSKFDATASDEGNISLRTIISMERAKSFERLSEFEKNLFTSKLELLTIPDSVINIVNKPEASADGRPMTPSLFLHLLVGTLLGVFLGIFGAFASVFIERVRQAMAEEKKPVEKALPVMIGGERPTYPMSRNI